AAVDPVSDEAEHEPAKAGVPSARALDDDHQPGECRRGAAEEGEQRPIDSPKAEVGPGLERELLVAIAPAQLDDRRVRASEREHRAERVHRPEELRLARKQDEDRDEAAEDEQRKPRRLEARVKAAEDLR